jgi:hypothetical protein
MRFACLLSGGALALSLAGCGGASASHPPATVTPPASTPAHAASPAAATGPATGNPDCAKLGASAAPLVDYENMLIRDLNRIVAIHGGGNASRADIRAARSELAGEISVFCPQFSYLARK